MERRISLWSASNGFMMRTGTPRPASVMLARLRSPFSAKQ